MQLTTKWMRCLITPDGNRLVGEPFTITTVDKSITGHYAHAEALLDQGLWVELRV